jgi:hypothetical protein
MSVVFGRPRLRSFRILILAAALTVGVAVAMSVRAQADAPPLPMGWTPGAPLPGSFGQRWDYSAAYFPPMDEVVLFGGAPADAGQPWHNDTWVYSVQSESWAAGPAAPGDLSVRGGATMAYDPVSHKLVLFGGANSNWPPMSDTWLFDGTSWTEGPATPAGMSGRVGAQMVYDDALGKIVLFGGSGTGPLLDTWFYDGAANSWSQGPSAPPSMKPRVFFGMAYDQSLGKIVVAGGDGDVDVWFFDGTAWSRGLDLLPQIAARERLRLVYNPDLTDAGGQAGVMLFGGMGPVTDEYDSWMLRAGQWVPLQFDPEAPTTPTGRFDSAMVWVPTADAVMMIGGTQDTGNGWGVVIGETWWYRDSPPQASSVDITPSNPDAGATIKASVGPVNGGIGDVHVEYQWHVKGTLQADQTAATLFTPVRHGDTVQVKVRFHDLEAVYGPWVSSPVVTIANRAPKIQKVTLTPSSPSVIDTIRATPTGRDDDGDAVAYHYAWTVNGNPKGGDQPTLAPANFKAGQVVSVKVTPTDSLGLSGTPVISPVATVQYNVQAQGTVRPGGSVLVQGGGFAPNETVDIHLDSATGLLLATMTTTSKGSWPGRNIAFPSPLVGGGHTMYGVGQTSGKVGPGPVTVVPGLSVTPSTFKVGTSVVVNGVGFIPGEPVWVSFPRQGQSMTPADSVGSISQTVVVPPEPYPGDVVTATSSAAPVTAAYTIVPAATAPATAVPNAEASVGASGFKPNDVVKFSIDSGPTLATATADANGSASASITMTGYFGPHTVSAKSSTSGLEATVQLAYPATLQLSVSQGGTGTVVSITSGPGWVPGETLTFLVGGMHMGSVPDPVVAPDGTATVSWTVPGWLAPGVYKVELNSATLGQVAWQPYTKT